MIQSVFISVQKLAALVGKTLFCFPTSDTDKLIMMSGLNLHSNAF